MKKSLNTDSIASELRDASPFFRRQTPPPAAIEETPAAQSEREPGTEQRDPRPSRSGSTPRTSRRPRTPQHPAKRVMKRHSFEIYYDQYDRLIQLAATDRMAGGRGSMSEMVRDAIDRLIAEQRREDE